MGAGALRTLATAAEPAVDPAAADAPPPKPKWQPEPLTAAHAARNAALVDRLRGQVILAPLTRGNNLPFRRLCADFGAVVTTSEMGFARPLLKGDPKERTRLRRADNEQLYGVQIATNVIDEGVAAGRMAADAGADWVDLNCGCPIYEATRRGLGSALLRKPEKLARLVAGIARDLPVPLTVKVRTGVAEGSINVQRVVELLRDAGAAAVTVHGRTALQRYKKPADWGLIEAVAATAGVPVIGNGDILTHYEAQRRLDGGCLAVMVGRGALIRPWIFQEAGEGRELDLTAADRVGIYRRLATYMKEYFGDDERGRRKAFYFLPWHLGFFVRHRPLPQAIYGERSLQQPLISTRWEGVAATEAGETLEGLGPLERLLRCEFDGAWEPMAAALWEAGSDAEAVAALEAMGAAEVEGWEEQARLGDRDREGGSRDDRAEG